MRWIENQTGWSIRKFARTVRRHRTIEVQAAHTLTAADSLGRGQDRLRCGALDNARVADLRGQMSVAPPSLMSAEPADLRASDSYSTLAHACR